MPSFNFTYRRHRKTLWDRTLQKYLEVLLLINIKAQRFPGFLTLELADVTWKQRNLETLRDNLEYTDLRVMGKTPLKLEGIVFLNFYFAWWLLFCNCLINCKLDCFRHAFFRLFTSRWNPFLKVEFSNMIFWHQLVFDFVSNVTKGKNSDIASHPDIVR